MAHKLGIPETGKRSWTSDGHDSFLPPYRRKTLEVLKLRFPELTKATLETCFPDRLAECDGSALDDYSRLCCHLLSFYEQERFRREGFKKVAGLKAYKKFRKKLGLGETDSWDLAGKNVGRLFDHVRVYKHEAGFLVTSEPYVLFPEPLAILAEKLKGTGWGMSVGAESQYFPGRTFILRFLSPELCLRFRSYV